mmetsp:Transcript_61405/g.170258  ORF Transcript_61405/g.170258 Transcript_61405/m.170258 type:complete len:202 (+) Transcript_61405:193-798(+)
MLATPRTRPVPGWVSKRLEDSSHLQWCARSSPRTASSRGSARSLTTALAPCWGGALCRVGPSCSMPRTERWATPRSERSTACRTGHCEGGNNLRRGLSTRPQWIRRTLTKSSWSSKGRTTATRAKCRREAQTGTGRSRGRSSMPARIPQPQQSRAAPRRAALAALCPATPLITARHACASLTLTSPSLENRAWPTGAPPTR